MSQFYAQSMDIVPNAHQVVSSLVQLSPEDLQAILPPDFLVKVQDSLLHPKTSSTKPAKRHARGITKRKREAHRGVNAIVRAATNNAASARNAANGANGGTDVSRAVNSFMCFRCKFSVINTSLILPPRC